MAERSTAAVDVADNSGGEPLAAKADKATTDGTAQAQDTEGADPRGADAGQDSPAAANRVAVQLLAACDRLEYLPERGRPGLVPNTRELVALWPYVIVYRVTPDGVQVARIWHGAQDRAGK